MKGHDLSALATLEVATDWQRIYALIGGTLDSIAGRSCADLEIRFVRRRIISHHPVFGPRAALGSARVVKRTARVWVRKQDSRGDWIGPHYHTLFHELGHLAWDGPARQLVTDRIEGQKWLSCTEHLHGSMVYEPPYRVVEVMLKGIHSPLCIAETLAEYQADVFALRAATRLARKRGSFQPIAWDIQRSVWGAMCHGFHAHYPMILLSLWREKGDLKQVARLARSLPVTEILQWFSERCWIRRSEWYRMREELSHFMIKRWNMDLEENPVGAEIQYQQVRHLAGLCEEFVRDRTLLAHVQQKHGDPSGCFTRHVVRRGMRRFYRPNMLRSIESTVQYQQRDIHELVRQGVLSASWAEVQMPMFTAVLSLIQKARQSAKRKRNSSSSQ